MPMEQRTKLYGTRSIISWLLVGIAVILIVGIVFMALILYPNYQHQQAAEQHYKAGIAFQDLDDWKAAETEYRQAIAIDANHKDVQARLMEVRDANTSVRATATSQAVAQAEKESVKTTATAVAKPTVTAEALEARYQKGLGYTNLGRWLEAKSELQAIFEVDPNYKDVQSKLLEVEGEISKLVPTATLTIVATLTPIIIENIASKGKASASSVFSTQYVPQNAIDGIVGVSEKGEWASLGEREGAWLQVDLPKISHVRRIVLFDRPNNSDHILRAVISFSNGKRQDVGSLPNSGLPYKIEIPEDIECSWVRLDILDAQGPNIGIAEIEIWGW